MTPLSRSAAAALLCALFLACSSPQQPGGQTALADVYAPVVTGSPPMDAYIGLSLLPGGEIRHYDYPSQMADGPSPYIFSLDGGFSWKEADLPAGVITADQRSPVSGEYLRLLPMRDSQGAGLFVVRSNGGPRGTWELLRVSDLRAGMVKPPVFIRDGSRIVVPAQIAEQERNPGTNRACTFYSDDDGRTWQRSNLAGAPAHVPDGELHKGPRWQNGACEPTVVELSGGRLWMLARTSQDVLFESFSNDGGETWSAMAPSRFYSTLTMPTLLRLADGRILLLWNNTSPLPEVERSAATRFLIGTDQNDGIWEDVFTNRDAFHAAVSEDDGRSWTGFREVLLNPRRNDRDYGETGGIDRSVHQSQALELDEGKLLISVGQHPLHRALLLFDIDWLYEKTRDCSFEHDLAGWSTHSYIAGIRGHCAFNRKPGAALVDHPGKPGRKALLVRRVSDRSLVSENQGAVWNFPAGRAGSLKVRLQPREGSQGGAISLLDRWVNPTDLAVDPYAMFHWPLELEPGRWHELEFTWERLADEDKDVCSLTIDGAAARRLPLRRPSRNGISYVHFISTASREDTGFLIESVSAAVR